ncbi:MAG: type II toxin-antitoxin system RelE/ParE family toxin [Kiritimatiellae bacterium]|nr:type II toxin-antitoxin system RelE/ParE family toxin [Kiritimatiellia bacterium]
MTFDVHVTAEAQGDLLDVCLYIAENDSPEKAEYVLDKLEATCAKLEYAPMKGHLPPELERIGVDNYREIHWKPYRLIYEIVDRDVYVHAVLDGRRDLQAVLEQRLLR